MIDKSLWDVECRSQNALYEMSEREDGRGMEGEWKGMEGKPGLLGSRFLGVTIDCLLSEKKKIRVVFFMACTNVNPALGSKIIGGDREANLP